MADVIWFERNEVVFRNRLHRLPWWVILSQVGTKVGALIGSISSARIRSRLLVDQNFIVTLCAAHGYSVRLGETEFEPPDG